METLQAWDRWLLLLINGGHSPGADVFFSWASSKYGWLPLYLLWLGVLTVRLRWSVLGVLAAVACCVVLTDQLSSGLLKPWVGRLRPCHEPDLAPLLHLVNAKCGGRYGFVSSHAANSWGLVLLLWHWLRHPYRVVALSLALWAALTSLSRVYLGVHYPADVVAGGVLGAVVGWAVGRLARRWVPGLRP